MDKLKHSAFRLLIVLTFFLSACQKENFEKASTIRKKDPDVSTILAKKVAQNFTAEINYLKKSSKRNTSVPSISDLEKKEIDEVIIIPDENDSPAIYVVTFIPQGYVVVSATKRESPILGYSENAIFDLENIPLGMINWLSGRLDKIQVLKYSEGFQIPDEVEKQWAQAAPPEDKEVVVSGGTEHEQKGPLLTTQWGQLSGFNTLLEPIDGELPPAGCVATAIAQVMKYHKFPANYDWSAMLDNRGTYETAKLMKDIGVAVKMDYSLDGSGANVEEARKALINTFGYSASAKHVSYNTNSVIMEINNNRPVIMEGYHTHYTTTTGWWIFERNARHYETGHAWVCDGYRRTLYLSIHNPGTRYEHTTSTTSGYFLHMNWGWSGAGMTSYDNNGWFKYDDWEIDGRNFEDGKPRNYQYSQKCIIGIKP